MAVALDQALGTGNGTGSGTSTITTIATVAAGTHILVVIGWFHNGVSTVAMSGGGLTWAEDAVLRAGSLHISIQRAYAASGLASGSTLTATFTGATPDNILGAGSFSGIDTTGTVVTSTTNNAATAAWSSGSAAANNGNFLFGGAFMDGAATTSTPTSPAAELYDVNVAGQTESETGAYKLSVAGSDSVDGTWATAASWAAAAVAYKAAPATVPGLPPDAKPHLIYMRRNV